ncbi:Retrovirus Polyprotein [Phytophthora palmivora]|uniref:Retrovirus Polyprotein n=1 Tax=Phytophthora palmivora TaxID=4796 RepID=A0A2P4X5A5_9STRA|nr:Retrovirus Polyprotein [Phytophthora palmivora]
MGCFVSRVGVRADPGKFKAIVAWSTPWSQKDLRKWLAFANYPCKYITGFYTSFQLAEQLETIGFNVCGTIQMYRFGWCETIIAKYAQCTNLNERIDHLRRHTTVQIAPKGRRV